MQIISKQRPQTLLLTGIKKEYLAPRYVVYVQFSGFKSSYIHRIYILTRADFILCLILPPGMLPHLYFLLFASIGILQISADLSSLLEYLETRTPVTSNEGESLLSLVTNLHRGVVSRLANSSEHMLPEEKSSWLRLEASLRRIKDRYRSLLTSRLLGYRRRKTIAQLVKEVFSHPIMVVNSQQKNRRKSIKTR